MLAKLCLHGSSKLSSHESPVQSSWRGVHQQDFIEQLRVKPAFVKCAECSCCPIPLFGSSFRRSREKIERKISEVFLCFETCG